MRSSSLNLPILWRQGETCSSPKFSLLVSGDGESWQQWVEEIREGMLEGSRPGARRASLGQAVAREPSGQTPRHLMLWSSVRGTDSNGGAD